MQQEFGRDVEWSDWCGVSYSLASEWAYVNGPAVRREGCTAGTRDDENEGKLPSRFLDEVNEYVQARRALGRGVTVPGDKEEDERALLTLDEVLAIRLYSGPAFQPINGFLRAVASLHGVFRTQFATNVSVTFAATTRLIISGLRKLSPSPIPTTWSSRSTAPSAVRSRPLSTCRTSLGCSLRPRWVSFSTSHDKEVATHYMASDGKPNVLWVIHPKPETTGGYHYGADVSMLSQYAAEREVLFPPCTMLQVIKLEELRAKLKTRMSAQRTSEQRITAGLWEDSDVQGMTPPEDGGEQDLGGTSAGGPAPDVNASLSARLSTALSWGMQDASRDGKEKGDGWDRLFRNTASEGTIDAADATVKKFITIEVVPTFV